ncbi:glycoside hydrolase, partial [Nadsonia fulvescens var. elongata DSM 6958]
SSIQTQETISSIQIEPTVVPTSTALPASSETVSLSTIQIFITSSVQTQETISSIQIEPTVVPTSTALSSTAATPSSTSSPNSGSIVPRQLTYSPYNDDNTCKDYSSIYADLTFIKGKGINSIRMYGVDCGSIGTVQTAASALGLTISQGFYITSAGVDSIDADVDNIISWAGKNGWSIFTDFIVGNEAIINGWVSADQLIGKINSIRSKFQTAGYSGYISTAEPPNIYHENPALCNNLDFIGINAHAYFDPNSSAATAGEFLASQIVVTKKFCPGKTVYVTETGYPSAGIQNGNNIPSVENQAIAIKSIINVVGTDLTLFTLYNDFWKSPGPYGVEQYFGL